MDESNDGYAAATFGALGGAMIVGVFGCCVGVAAAEYHESVLDYSRGGEPFGLPIIVLGASIGIWVGEVVGCWLLLNAWDHSDASATAVLLAGLLALSIGGLVWSAANNISFLWLKPVLFLVMPAVARALTNGVGPAGVNT